MTIPPSPSNLNAKMVGCISVRRRRALDLPLYIAFVPTVFGRSLEYSVSDHPCVAFDQPRSLKPTDMTGIGDYTITRQAPSA